MSRVSDYLALIDDSERKSLVPGHPSDAALHHLLVELAFSDGVVQGDEFALLQRVRPDLDAASLMQWAMDLSDQTLGDDQLRWLVSQGEDATDVLRFAARMVCLDGDVADEERARLGRIAAIVGLDASAPDRAIGEIVARGGYVPKVRVFDALRNMLWRVVSPRRGDPERAELLSAAPANAEAVCTMEVDGVEAAALYDDGLLAVFADGAAFVRFEDIATYTRVPVPGAGFHLRTRDGRHHAVLDPRLADLGSLLDYLYAK